MKWHLSWLLASLLLAPSVHAEADSAVVDALEEYFDFITYEAGHITSAQIPREDYAKFFILDVRKPEQYAEEHLPGAKNIEWRQVFAQREKLPRDQSILLYCNTGSLAPQVALALRVDGFENVQILYGGFQHWKASQR